jgi:TolB-like protein
VRRCLEKKPEDRFQSSRDLAFALEAVSGSGAASAAPETGFRTTMARRRIWIGGAAAALLLATAAILVLGVLDVGGLRSRLPGGEGGSRSIRMAVLPFANLSGDPEQEYLSDGLTQEMIAQLGSLHPESLSVIARTSVMHYKKTDAPISQIGRELNVDYVLEGSARREGNRVRITAELIRVRDQSQLWANSFEREMSGILALQSDVARKVAEALSLKLLPSERTRLAARHTVNPEAHDAYLKGSQYWPRLAVPDLDTAERFFNLALEKDPSFAPAHAGLAMVWIGRQQMGFTPPSVAGPKSKAEARRAVELDDTVAEAHLALATVLTWTDWDFVTAGGEWARAIELDPSNAQARAFYSHYLMTVGRPGEAKAQIEAALKGDPFNVIVRAFYMVDLVYLRRFEDALTAARDVLRMQPDEGPALAVCWLVSARLGRRREAIESARRYVTAGLHDSDAGRAFDEGYARGGYSEAMKCVADVLAARSRASFVLPFDTASFYLEAGDKARALDWLEKGYEVRDPNMPYIGWAPFDDLRAEPRFQTLLRKMNLPTEMPTSSTHPAGSSL